MTFSNGAVKRTSPTDGDIFGTHLSRSTHWHGVVLTDDDGVPVKTIADGTVGGVTDDTLLKEVILPNSVLYQCDVVLDAGVAAQRWLFLFDALSSSGTPFRVRPIPAGGSGSLTVNYGIHGRRTINVAVTLAISTSLTSLTPPAGVEGRFYLRIKA